MTSVFRVRIPLLTFRRDPMWSSAVFACFPGVRIPFWRLLVWVGQIRTFVCALGFRIKQLHHGGGDGPICKFPSCQFGSSPPDDGGCDDSIVPIPKGCFTPVCLAHHAPGGGSKCCRIESGPEVASLGSAESTLGDPVGQRSGQFRKAPFGKIIENISHSLGNSGG